MAFQEDEGGASRLQSYLVANAKEDESQAEWDLHGLSANVVLQMNKLSGFKKYKVSDVVFVDKLTSESIGSDDSFNEMVMIRPGGVYTKAQLQKELETLATCGMFEKVDIESTTKPDRTVGIAISFVKSSWSVADRFKCINVGLMAPSKTVDKDLWSARKVFDKMFERRVVVRDWRSLRGV